MARVTVNIDTTTDEDGLVVTLNNKVEEDVGSVCVYNYGPNYDGDLTVSVELMSATQDDNGVRRYLRTMAEELTKNPKIKAKLVSKEDGDWEKKAIADIIQFYAKKGK